jgi:two-component system chemotaxis response regulator CheY
MCYKVLVCDDALFMRTMIRQTLEQAGYEVVGEAEDGQQAIDRYKEHKPDLVTMDIVMPGLGGIDSVQEIVRMDPNARIVVCSAMGQDALATQAMAAGAKEYVVKPFQASHILEAAVRALA